jgi:type III secretion protein C
MSAIGVACFAMPLLAFGAEPVWPAGPYPYIVVNQDVREVLKEFSANLHLPVKVSDHVQSRRLRGPYTITTANGFLKTVCDAASLVWYYDGSVLYISSAGEISTASIPVASTLAPQNLYRQLQGYGVLDERYTFKSDPITGVVTVAGPPPYIATVKQTLDNLAKARGRSDDTGVHIFRGGTSGK